MKNKKFSLIALMLIAMLAILTACGGGEEKASQEQDPTETEQTESDVEEEPETTPAGDRANGLEVYKNNCLACHGTEDAGGHNGPNLQTSSVSDDLAEVIAQVKDGGPAMPEFEGSLTEEEINDVSAYITEEVAPLE